VLDAGAQLALVSGSGPTVIGLFEAEAEAEAEAGAAGAGRTLARAAVSALGARQPAPIYAEPVDAAFGRAASDLPVRHNSPEIQ
jgi:hypothetical protein